MFETIQSVYERGMTVLLAEQNVRRALAIADVGHVLNDGRLEVSGPATELLERDDVRRAYLGG